METSHYRKSARSSKRNFPYRNFDTHSRNFISWMICPQDICISPVGKMIEVKFLQPMRAIGRKQEPKTTKQIIQSYNITFELSKQHINSLLFLLKETKNNHLNVDCYSKNQGKNRAIPELEPSNLLLLLFLNLFPRLILFWKQGLLGNWNQCNFRILRSTCTSASSGRTHGSPSVNPDWRSWWWEPST